MRHPSGQPPHRWPSGSLVTTVVLFLAMVLGGALLYTASLNHQLAARQHLQRETERLRATRDDLRRLPQHLSLLQAAELDFQHMTRRDFSGDGNRLDWISALTRVGRRMGLDADASPNSPGIDSLTWQLQPHRPHATLTDLWVTPMILRVAPVSAASLDELLRGLAAEARGVFSVDSCQLTLDGPSNAAPTGQAECQLSWWNWRAGGGRAADGARP